VPVLAGEVKKLAIVTTRPVEMLDITASVQSLVAQSGVEQGVCLFLVPHTTCGLTVNENADPDVARDLLQTLDRIVPARDDYRHQEGNSPAHVKAALLGTSQTLVIDNFRIRLGTWQGIFLCEFDGPRQRQVWVKIMEG
jgi:secondary thiamine-phosphate synthase enzyme